MSELPGVAERMIDELGERLAQAPQVMQDALLVRLENDVQLTVRFGSADEYSIEWEARGQTLRIDTAPLHRDLATFPNHLHGPDGVRRADPLTDPRRPPWENVRAVVMRILSDPLLQR